MTTAYIWIVIFGLGAVTLLTRCAFSLLPKGFQLPPNVRHALRYAPACALVAIVAPDLLMSPGVDGPVLNLSVQNFRLIAGLCAGAIFLYTRNMVLMIVAGMLIFTGLRLYV